MVILLWTKFNKFGQLGWPHVRQLETFESPTATVEGQAFVREIALFRGVPNKGFLQLSIGNCN